MRKGAKIVRYMGIVCWFLALFLLVYNHQVKKQEEQSSAITTEAEEVETGETQQGTVIFPE